MVEEEVMSFFMEKLKEALLMMLNFGDQVLQMMLNFVGQLLRKPVNFIGQGLISLKNFGWHVLLSLLNFFGQVPLALKNLVMQVQVTLNNLGGHALVTLKIFGCQVLVTLKNLGVQVLVTLENIGGQALLALKNIGSQALLALDSFTWQVKNLCEQLVNWVDKVFPPETRVERISHWFHVALPYLIIALFLALFIYCCFYHGQKTYRTPEMELLNTLPPEISSSDKPQSPSDHLKLGRSKIETPRHSSGFAQEAAKIFDNKISEQQK